MLNQMGDKAIPSISATILAHNSDESLEDLATAVINKRLKPQSLILLDNGSTERQHIDAAYRTLLSGIRTVQIVTSVRSAGLYRCIHNNFWNSTNFWNG